MYELLVDLIICIDLKTNFSFLTSRKCVFCQSNLLCLLDFKNKNGNGIVLSFVLKSLLSVDREAHATKFLIRCNKKTAIEVCLGPKM